jgi:hypothetical protein
LPAEAWSELEDEIKAEMAEAVELIDKLPSNLQSMPNK